MLYQDSDKERRCGVAKPTEPYRTEFRRDYDRILHAPAFRRLQGKTQLFPISESDFFRNRLTHSLEVAEIATSIANRFNREHPLFSRHDYGISTDIVAAAALAHDLGHPPFGHIGEAALDECMRAFGGFEGNAQSLRIVSRLEKRDYKSSVSGALVSDVGIAHDGEDCRCGLNLTYRTLAAILKYDEEIYGARNPLDSFRKGFYADDREIVEEVKQHVVGDASFRGLKTIECSIMDLADDIAYSTFDMEDALKSGFITLFDVLGADWTVLDEIAVRVNDKMTENQYAESFEYNPELVQDTIWKYFGGIVTPEDEGHQHPRDTFTTAYSACRQIASNGHYRAAFFSDLVASFILRAEVQENRENPALSTVYLPTELRREVEVLKKLVFSMVTNSARFSIAASRAKEIVQAIFYAIAPRDGELRFELLPNDFRDVCALFHKEIREPEERQRKCLRTVCDFVASMTDRYALEFYGRLRSENPQTIFKPTD